MFYTKNLHEMSEVSRSIFDIKRPLFYTEVIIADIKNTP